MSCVRKTDKNTRVRPTSRQKQLNIYETLLCDAIVMNSCDFIMLSYGDLINEYIILLWESPKTNL